MVFYKKDKNFLDGKNIGFKFYYMNENAFLENE